MKFGVSKAAYCMLVGTGYASCGVYFEVQDLLAKQRLEMKQEF
jgi:hypothetical protein